jgi:hypothetical protein
MNQAGEIRNKRHSSTISFLVNVSETTLPEQADLWGSMNIGTISKSKLAQYAYEVL